MAKRNKIKYYYRDEINDDFATLQIKSKQINSDFNYVNKHKLYWLFVHIARLTFIIPFLNILSKIVYRTKVKNKQVLKRVKKTGYFLYSNHTSSFDPINHVCLVNQSKYSAIIASLETFSIKGLKEVVHFLGAIPIPVSPKMYRNFHEALHHHINHKHKIIIYPEAHIWPFYNDIRPFKSVSFRYPVEFNAPIIIATTIYKKRRFAKKPKMEIYLDGPFYKNNNLMFKEQIDNLRNIAYETMKKRINQFGSYATYEYIKIKDD